MSITSDLDGKVALVTGAGKGIGAGIAEALAAEGAVVAVNYGRDAGTAGEVVERITNCGGRAQAFQADVSSEADVARLFADVRGTFGPVQVLINNAGVFTFGPLESITVAEFHRHFDTNVLGGLLATREFVRQPEADGGAVVFISSVGVGINTPNSALYTSTKIAQVGLTRVLSKELAPRRIRVNAIAAGLTNTEGTRASGFIGSEAEAALIAAEIPLGRTGLPEDIAPVAVFLASEAARWVTGELIFASGGQR